MERIEEVLVSRERTRPDDARPRSDVPGSPASSPSRLPCVIAVTLLVAGIAASLVGGFAWSSLVRTQTTRAFDTMTGTAADALSTALQRDADLTATAKTLVETTPSLTNAEFSAWFRLLGAKSAYPGSFGLLYVESVAPASLTSFARQVVTDPPLGLPMARPFALTPASPARQYCLTRAGVVKVSETTGLSTNSLASLLSFTTPDLNYCALPIGKLLRASAATDRQAVVTLSSLMRAIPRVPGVPTVPSFLPAVVQQKGLVATVSPVYAPTAARATPSQRLHALRGWVLAIYDANSILSALVRDHRDASAVLSFENPAHSMVRVGRAGPLDQHGMNKTYALAAAGRWSVTLSVPPPVSGLTASDQGIVLAGAGALLSLLVFLLIRVLSQSRSRALQLVEERTAQLRHQAFHDALTDLPNRELIFDRAAQMLARARRDGTSLAALFIDIDGFKDVNDTFGHGAGDELLLEVAHRLASGTRDTDTVGRLGGDEFVVLVELNDGEPGPEQIAAQLLASLNHRFCIGNGKQHLASISASIGIAVGTRDSAEELLRDADVALYEAKASGRGRYVVFDSAMQAAVATRLGLEEDLHAAVEHQQFFLVYQPTYFLADQTITGAEALLRWRHPTRGVVMPKDFIHALEATDLIVPVGRFVLEEACRQAAEWARSGHPLPVSVNVSGRQLDRQDFVATVRQTLEGCGLEARWLTLEITESTLMRNSEQSVAQLQALKRIGVNIAIDDFGTGYCSLAYLQQFPVDSLKIDQSFVAGMRNSSEGASLVRTIVQMGRDLDLETLAEGIETSTQLEQLRLEACTKGQGFLFARPLEPEAIAKLLANESRAALPAPAPQDDRERVIAT